MHGKWCQLKEILHCFRGGGFRYFLFSPLFVEDFQIDSYFSDGLKPPTSFSVCLTAVRVEPCFCSSC